MCRSSTKQRLPFSLPFSRWISFCECNLQHHNGAILGQEIYADMKAAPLEILRSLWFVEHPGWLRSMPINRRLFSRLYPFQTIFLACEFILSSPFVVKFPSFGNYSMFPRSGFLCLLPFVFFLVCVVPVRSSDNSLSARVSSCDIQYE